MVTEEQLNWLSHQVYSVDTKKSENIQYEIEPQRTYFYNTENKQLGQYKVLKTTDLSNGMQAMAVAPLDESGKVDYSEVVIAYAGTNIFDYKDLDTDFQSLGLGSDLLMTNSSVTGDLTIYKSQFNTALDFAKEVETEVTAINPEVTITTTGHSLGESQALYVALKQGYDNVGYNGPDIHQLISDDEVAYMQNNQGQFRNYRNPYDFIGNITGDSTKSAIYVNVNTSKKYIPGKFLDYHNLSTWQYDEDGNLIDVDGQIVSHDGIALNYKTQKSLEALSEFKRNTLAAGGLSSAEQLFLDSEQALIVADSLARGAEDITASIETTRDNAVEALETLWRSVEEVTATYTRLSYEEVVNALAEAGVTRESIVTKGQEHFDERAEKARAVSDSFAELRDQTQSGIGQLVETDQELAGIFNQWTEKTNY